MVALMTSALNLSATDRVLEVGTGSGYQAAILSLLVPQGRVITVERLPSLASNATDLLATLEYTNVDVRQAGTVLGAPGEAPFDAIMVTAGAPQVPKGLVHQLRLGGRIVIPVGSLREQDLIRVTKTSEGITTEKFLPCAFVPLVGEDAWPDADVD
jgi:protein-L-isoaspartate(D-aspartate) O-methyltransferase